MHYKIGVTGVYNEQSVTWQSNPPSSQFNGLCNEFMSVWSMFVYNTSIQIAVRMQWLVVNKHNIVFSDSLQTSFKVKI